MSEFITNAELRIEAERLCDENDELKDENAKLSDFVFDLYCDLHESNPSIYNKYGSRLRELGIEVDK